MALWRRHQYTPYATEDDLQDLIAQQPELLAGALINPRDPRRWLLIRREAGVPDREGAGGYWALDHLLVDQDAVPTLVEVKRSSDPRIRREVVAQLLEYAANGSVYWDAAVVRAWFEADRQAAGRDPVTELSEFVGFGTDQDPEVVADRFWGDFDADLRASRIRLLFVAEAIPAPLRRLIEFLNEQMPGVRPRHWQSRTIDRCGDRGFNLNRPAAATHSGLGLLNGTRQITLTQYAAVS
jgi:hypothetical protein